MKTMRLEYWPVGRLKPYGRKLRKNGPHMEKMMDSIREFGFRIPLLALEDGEIVDGGFRLQAAVKLGMDTVPVIPAEDMSPEQVKAFRLMANRSAAWSQWDQEALQVELAELQALEIDLALTGFPIEELNDILAIQTGDKDPDEVPAVPTTPVSRPGDLWILGPHRLLCGDSRRSEDVEQLMDGARADMVWTDPPYNVDYQGKAGKIKNDKMADAAFHDFLLAAFSALYGAVSDGGAVYVAHADTEGLNFRSAFKEAGFKLASCLIWRKNSMVLGHSDYQWMHEPILYGWKPTGPHRWYGGRNKTTMQEFVELGLAVRTGKEEYQIRTGDTMLVVTGQDVCVEELVSSVVCEKKPERSVDHPTMKPVALIERFLKNSSGPGDLVLDTFGGSGSTLIACERTHRICRTIELDPRFCDVIVRRWQDYAGQAAYLESGIMFADMAEARTDG